MLRRLRDEDFEAFRALIEDKMASEWAPYDAQWSTEEMKLRGALKWFGACDYWYAMDYEGDLIGFVVTPLSEDGTARDIGYTVRRDMHRQGFAYEACAAVLREAAKDEKIVKFTAGTAECNYPSVGLLKKLGFEVRARHRAWFMKDENGEPMWFMGYSFECPAEKWRI